MKATKSMSMTNWHNSKTTWIWIKPRWRFRVLHSAVLTDGFWSPDADFEKFHFFQIWVWNRGPGILKKKSFHSFLVGIWRRVALWWRVPKLWKNIEFSWFSHQNIWFYLGKFVFLKFWGQLGTMDDHIHFEQPKKSLKNLEFFEFFFGSPVCGQQSRVRK